MISVGQAGSPGLGCRWLAAVTFQHVGQHGDRLPGVRAGRSGIGRRRQESASFALGTVEAVEFGCRAGAGLGVGWPGRGGEHERHVVLGAAGHRRVEPLAVFAAGDHGYAGVHGCALRGVPGDRVRQITGVIAKVGEGLAGKPPLPGLGVGVEHAADHDGVIGDGVDPQDVAVGQGPAGLRRPRSHGRFRGR